MRITLYQPRLSYYIGGGEVVPVNQAIELAKIGHQIDILTTRAPFIKESALLQRIKSVPKISIRYIDVPQKMKWIYDVAAGEDWERWDNESLHVGLLAREVLNRSRSDLIVSHLLFDSIACPENIPSVLHLHGYPSRFSYHHRLLARIPDAFISVSQTIKDKWRKIIPSDATNYVITNGIDTERFKPNLVEQKYDLLYVGRLLPVKGIDTLIEAGALMPGVKIAIAGAGPIGDRLQQLVRQRGIENRVSFLGYVPDEDLPSLYNSARITVLPSRDREGILTTLLEAAASGRSIITTSTGSMTEFINDKVDGIVIPPDSPVRLAEAVNILLKDQEQRDKIGRRARQKIVEEWAWSNKIQPLEKTYREITARHRGLL
jgi:glycosyltransferase involved in cell wall biosynthesis